jgi:predicted GIY-YIG superfamily endonuclease
MIELVNPEGHLAVYLLHFEEPVDGARHYVGITTYARLGARMIEHTTGRGARLTSSACRVGVAWRLAHVWRTDQAALEPTLIGMAERAPLCPVCRQVSSGIPYRPTRKGGAAKRRLFDRFHLDPRVSFPNEEVPLFNELPENKL